MKHTPPQKTTHAPHTQLVEAGKVARQMLIERGFARKESLQDILSQTENPPMLPGIPEYLPHRWTLKSSQRVMYDLLIMWGAKCKKEKKDEENIIEFFKFVLKEMKKIERKFIKKTEEMGELIKTVEETPVLKEIFDPLRRKESVHGMHDFFMHSFVVSVAVKSNSTTSEYAEWFLGWTEQLYLLWGKQNDKLENLENKINEETNNNKTSEGTGEIKQTN